MSKLHLKAKQDHLEKIAACGQPIKALSEFIWNALDAEAAEVIISLNRNELGGIQSIEVTDDGTGISEERAKGDFGNLGDSWKRKAHKTKTKGRSIHGQEGQGRLRFFSLSRRCKWYSTFKIENKLQGLDIEIRSNALESCEINGSLPPFGEKTGTRVLLDQLKEPFDRLTEPTTLEELSIIFAPYLMEYPDVAIFYDGHKINPASSISQVHDFDIEDVQTTNRLIKKLKLKVVEWHTNIESRRIHFGSADGIVLGSQAANVVAPDFQYSAYAYNEYFQEISDAGLLELEGINDPDFSEVIDHIRIRLSDYFRQRKSERSHELIARLKDEGVYPYKGEPKDAVEKTERQVFNIATYAVSSYSRDFNRAEPTLKKMTLTLLKKAVQSNPDDLNRILQEIVSLPKSKQKDFAELLNKTELSNVISASNLIADRIGVIHTLSSVVFDPKIRNIVKERGQLDLLIQDNTWIFGEKYNISLSESGLTKVVERVANELAIKRKRKSVKKADGKKGRVDLFLGKTIPVADTSKKEFLIVELKKPSITIGKKEADQIEAYCDAITKQPDFIDTDTSWDFFLVSSEYDEYVKSRITQPDRPKGILYQGNNFKVWVKSWAEIIRENESRNAFVQEKLKIVISDEEIQNRISKMMEQA